MSISALGASLILGGASAGLSGITQALGAKRQFKYQSKLNQQAFDLNQQALDNAYQRDLDMWNKQNEYNSPSQQMARLQAAGLNPNLIYGSSDGGTAAPAPSAHAASYSPPSAPNLMESFANSLGSLTQSAHLANEFAQGDFILANTKKVLAEKEGIDLENQRKGMFNLHADELYSSNASLAARKVGLTDANTNFLRQRTNLTEAQIKTEAQKLTESTFRIAKILADIDYTHERQKVIPYTIQSLNASATNAYANAGFTSQKSAWYETIVNTELELAYQKTRSIKEDIELKKISEKEGKARIQKIKADIMNSFGSAIQKFNNPTGVSGETGNIIKTINGTRMEDIDKVLDQLLSF